jgi:hypothetical protein
MTRSGRKGPVGIDVLLTTYDATYRVMSTSHGASSSGTPSVSRNRAVIM